MAPASTQDSFQGFCESVRRTRTPSLPQHDEAHDSAMPTHVNLRILDVLGSPENEYTVTGTSYATSATLPAIQTPAYTAATGTESLDEEEDVQADADKPKPPPCTGPVRHSDSPECVAKKAMAQALQVRAFIYIHTYIHIYIYIYIYIIFWLLCFFA
jgi:hypothetical protein